MPETGAAAATDDAGAKAATDVAADSVATDAATTTVASGATDGALNATGSSLMGFSADGSAFTSAAATDTAAGGAAASASGSLTGSTLGDAALKAVGQGIGLTAAQTLMGALAKPKATPQAPGVPQAAVMPTADSAAIQQAQTNAIISQMARTGRASTIMTDNGSNKLGD